MRSRSRWVAVFAAATALILMVIALWAWRDALALGARATRPEVACWAIRSAAVAAGAGAQLLLLTLVVRRRARAAATGGTWDDDVEPPSPTALDIVSVSVGLVGSIALVAAAALGLAGR